MEQTRPLSSLGRSGSKSKHVDSTDHPGSTHASGKATDVRPSSFHHHQLRATVDHRSQGNNIGSRPSARSSQHPGRFSVQCRPDTEHGVDDGHGASPTSIGPVGSATGRLVCDVCQQMTHQVCIAISGPQGGVHGRHVSAVGQWDGPPVHLSTIQDGPSSPAEGRSVSRCSDDSDRSTAGNSFLVPGTSGTFPRRSHPAVRRRSSFADSGYCSA